jgi:hypothetical protein
LKNVRFTHQLDWGSSGLPSYPSRPSFLFITIIIIIVIIIITFAPLRFAIDPSGRARLLFFSSPLVNRHTACTDLDRPPPADLKRPPVKHYLTPPSSSSQAVLVSQ